MGKFKQFVEKPCFNSMMNEGGLGSHMAHPYDYLSPDDFLDFFEKLLTGKLDTTEKVDGVNLFVGFNKAGKVVFARNRTEAPSTDIEKKFPVTHPGGDAFRAGFAALKKGLEEFTAIQRNEFGLTNADGTPRAFINLEIIYGEIPNLIQYSETDNYIVFHSLHGTEEQGYPPLDFKPSTLSDMAKTINSVIVKSEVVDYVGPINDVKRTVRTADSKWIFKGQVEIPTARIKSDLESVANKFKRFPEVKQLQNKDKLSDDELHEVMKSLAAKVGSEILINLSSQLFSGQRKTPSNHPKIEGMVTKYGDSLIKITGDFAALNQKLWEPLKDGLDAILKELTGEIISTHLKIPNLTQIQSRSWMAAGIEGNPIAFLMAKNKKEYKDGMNINLKIDKQKIVKDIDNAFDKLQSEYDVLIKDVSNVKQKDIIRALRIGGFKLNELKKGLKNVNTRVELLQLIASTMFGL